MLGRAGHSALFVGGCVRNALIGVTVNDIDIATDALPATVTDLAEQAGMRVVPTGIDHGTVTVVSGGIPHEVTTFRRDVETTGRHAVVAFSTDVAEDAARRDFTMNALYARPDGTLVDPLGCLADLDARKVRFVGDPSARITEDYLRILRFFRFHAWYGDPAGGIDADGLAACAALSGGIGQLSRERVGSEIRRLLAAPDPAPAVAAMAASGVLARVLPGASAEALSILVALEGDTPASWLRRLAVLGPGANAAGDLRLARRDARALRARLEAIEGGQGPAELGYRFGAEVACDAILVRAALSGTRPDPGWRDDVARGACAVFPVAASDLMPALSDAALGTRLRELETRWIESGFTLDRDGLLG